MNVRRISALVSTVIAGSILLTGCTQGPADASSRTTPSALTSSSTSATHSPAAMTATAQSAAAAALTPKAASGSGTQDDPYRVSLTTYMSTPAQSKTVVYGSGMTSLSTCGISATIEGYTTLPDGTREDMPWMRRRAGDGSIYDSLTKSFTPDGSKTSTTNLKTCANGTLAIKWDGYTETEAHTLNVDGTDYYLFTYAPAGPLQVHVTYRRGVKANPYKYTLLNKKGKAVSRAKAKKKHSGVVAWRTAVSAYDWANKPLVLQKRTVKKVKGKWVIGAWKNYRSFKTNSAGTAQVVIPGGLASWNKVAVSPDSRSPYRVVIPGNPGWTTGYTYLNRSADTSWF